MKKILCLMLSVFMMSLFTACGSSAGKADITKQESTSESKAAVADTSVQGNTGKSKALVVYFSCTGRTKMLAEHAAKALQADLVEIQPKKPYTNEDLNYNDKSTRATMEQGDTTVRPEIQNKIDNMSQYDTVVLAYPIWWGQVPRIMDTFMESYDFSGKTMAAICTSGGSDIGDSDTALAELGSKSAKWKEGHQFMPDTSVAELAKWFNQIGLSQ